MPAPGSFDIMDAIRRTVLLFWADFAPLVIGGFLLLTLPGVIAHALGADGADSGQAGTVTQTLLAVLLMLYLAIVSFGATARLRGRALPAAPFLRGGLAAARPGLLAALVMGVALMTGVIVMLLARGHPLAWAVRGSVTGTLLWLLTVWIAAIPAAIVERLAPFDALRRSAELTRGNRGRLLGLIVIAALALLPGAMLVNTVIFGPGATPESAEAAFAAMDVTHPALWIDALFELLAAALLACIPPGVYHALARR